VTTTQDIKELLDLLADTDVSELLVEDKEGTRIRIRRGMHGPIQPMTAAAPVMAPAPAAAAAAAAAAATEAPAAGAESDANFITSPFVGTFYRSPSPESPPYVDVGQEVRPGEVICIVEAMKIMNEIESEVSGKVVEILVENGQAVEFGQRLFRIEPQ
jgi:acetyl-CoA carboxylase biotin carboxyl carrier protein